MLSAFILGSLVAGAMGPWFSVMSVEWWGLYCAASLSSRICLAAVLIWLCVRVPSKFKMLAPLIVSLCGFMMVLPFSPPQWIRGSVKVSVLYSASCGFDVTDLIVSDGWAIYAARGAAIETDEVLLKKRGAGPRSFGPSIEVPGSVGSGFICSAQSLLRSVVLENIARFPEDVRLWMSAFVFGAESAEIRSLVESFRSLGLLHALVLSGGHLALVYGLSQLLIRLPFQLFYILKKIPAPRWVSIWVTSRIVALIPLFAFTLVAGFGQSMQRALMAIVVACVADLTGFPSRRKTLVKVIAGIQIVIFPANLLSLAMMLSWSGVLILKSFRQSTFRKSLGEVLSQAVLIQLVFTLSSLVFFGEMSLLTLPANLLALPVISVLLPIDLLAVFLEIDALDGFVIWSNRWFIEILTRLALAQDSLPLRVIEMPAWARENTAIHSAMILAMFVALYIGVGLNDPVNRKARASSRASSRRQELHGSPGVCVPRV
jgi:ComEC/Rec2-related protein